MRVFGFLENGDRVDNIDIKYYFTKDIVFIRRGDMDKFKAIGIP